MAPQSKSLKVITAGGPGRPCWGGDLKISNPKYQSGPTVSAEPRCWGGTRRPAAFGGTTSVSSAGWHPILRGSTRGRTLHWEGTFL